MRLPLHCRNPSFRPSLPLIESLQGTCLGDWVPQVPGDKTWKLLVGRLVFPFFFFFCQCMGWNRSINWGVFLLFGCTTFIHHVWFVLQEWLWWRDGFISSVLWLRFYRVFRKCKCLPGFRNINFYIKMFTKSSQEW